MFKYILTVAISVLSIAHEISENSEAEVDLDSYTLGYSSKGESDSEMTTARRLSHKSTLFTTDSSRKCAEECIDKGAHFCPDTTYGSSGLCCIDFSC
jgi:hypothetical protein